MNIVLFALTVVLLTALFKYDKIIEAIRMSRKGPDVDANESQKRYDHYADMVRENTSTLVNCWGPGIYRLSIVFGANQIWSTVITAYKNQDTRGEYRIDETAEDFKQIDILIDSILNEFRVSMTQVYRESGKKISLPVRIHLVLRWVCMDGADQMDWALVYESPLST